MALATFLIETPCDYCLLCYSLCPLFAVMPRSLPSRWYPPYSAPLASAACHPMFEFYSFFVIFSFVFVITIVPLPSSPTSLPSLGSFVSSLPHQLDREILVSFFSSVPMPSCFFSSFFYSLPSGLVVSSFCCWSITWTYHKTDRTSRQHPCPLGIRPAP